MIADRADVSPATVYNLFRNKAAVLFRVYQRRVVILDERVAKTKSADALERIFDAAAHVADLYRKEAFGPVACIEAFDDFDQAIARVNDSDFGLQAGVFTASIEHAMQAWDRIEAGGIVIGDVPSFRVDNMPYGGIKHSGLGREGVRCAIEDMTETRLLVLRS